MVTVVPQSILDTNGNGCTPSRYSTQMVKTVLQSKLTTKDVDYFQIDTRHKWWRLYSSRHSTQMVKIALLLILDKHGNGYTPVYTRHKWGYSSVKRGVYKISWMNTIYHFDVIRECHDVPCTSKNTFSCYSRAVHYYEWMLVVRFCSMFVWPYPYQSYPPFPYHTHTS